MSRLDILLKIFITLFTVSSLGVIFCTIDIYFSSIKLASCMGQNNDCESIIQMRNNTQLAYMVFGGVSVCSLLVILSTMLYNCIQGRRQPHEGDVIHINNDSEVYINTIPDERSSLLDSSATIKHPTWKDSPSLIQLSQSVSPSVSPTVSPSISPPQYRPTAPVYTPYSPHYISFSPQGTMYYPPGRV